MEGELKGRWRGSCLPVVAALARVLLLFLLPEVLAPDLAGDGLRERVHELDDPRILVGCGHLLDMVLDLADQRLGRVDAGFDDDEGLHHEAADIVRRPDHRRLGDSRVFDERTLDLERTDPVSRKP